MANAGNPFAAHIASCNDDPAKIQELYASTRSARNAREEAKILHSSFTGWKIDSILAKLDGPKRDPDFVDHRHSIIICASPPGSVKRLIGAVQKRLKEVAPSLWLAPHDNLHITTLEIASSKTPEEAETIMWYLSKGLPELARFTVNNHSRLIKPMLNFDSAALALSFLPAAQQGADSDTNDQYTYHHLRRDVFSIAASTGVDIGSRYFVPSAHVTVARFINQDGFLRTGEDGQPQDRIDHARVQQLAVCVQEINNCLETEYWPRKDGAIPLGGEWTIGKDSDLECRKGRIWYGGGEDIMAITSHDYRN